MGSLQTALHAKSRRTRPPNSLLHIAVKPPISTIGSSAFGGTAAEFSSQTSWAPYTVSSVARTEFGSCLLQCRVLRAVLLSVPSTTKIRSVEQKVHTPSCICIFILSPSHNVSPALEEVCDVICMQPSWKTRARLHMTASRGKGHAKQRPGLESDSIS